MIPINFKEANKVLNAPECMPDCKPLGVFTDGDQCISCWKPSFVERIRILFTGKVWLSVLSGATAPPVWVSGMKTPFEENL